MSKAKRTRSWVVTDHLTTKKHIKALKASLLEDDKVLRAIVSLEKGDKTKKQHLQCYIELKHPKTMSATKSAYFSKKSHLEMRKGSAFQAWEYCEKEDKSPFIKGDKPEATTKGSSIWTLIKRDIDEGSSEWDIMTKYPASYARYSTGICKMIHAHDLKVKVNKWRAVEVIYLYGPTGIGKTRSCLSRVEDVSDAYRVTNYNNPFDGYQGQSVLILEEFTTDSFRFTNLLVYLDGYYCQLPCRYADKVSNWDTVFIVSNSALTTHYPRIQEFYPESYAALERRIDYITHMTKPWTPGVPSITEQAPLSEGTTEERLEQAFTWDIGYDPA